MLMAILWFQSCKRFADKTTNGAGVTGVGKNWWLGRTHLVPDLVTFNFSMRFTSKSPIPFRMVALHVFLVSVKSLNLPTGILVAESLFFNLFLYQIQGRPVFLFPSFSLQYIRIYIYVCVCVLFGPVKPELGVIPSGQKKTFNREHLNFPGKELNVTDITEQ